MLAGFACLGWPRKIRACVHDSRAAAKLRCHLLCEVFFVDQFMFRGVLMEVCMWVSFMLALFRCSRRCRWPLSSGLGF